MPHLAWPRAGGFHGGVAWPGLRGERGAEDNGRAQHEQNIHSEVGVAGWDPPSQESHVLGLLDLFFWQIILLTQLLDVLH